MAEGGVRSCDIDVRKWREEHGGLGHDGEVLELSDSVCYRAVQARDARFDGRFFTCVRTTGIYCRPICPARTPKQENCRFFSSAAEAQEAGFRPCLRCRPEISPDFVQWHGTSTTVSRALELIADGALDGDGSVATLAARLGMGERQLRRLFLQHVGVPPISVAQTRRFLFAKQLLHDTQLSMTEIAMAAGFGSLRRFNATFRAAYDRSPRELRRRRASETADTGAIRLSIPYKLPYDFAGVLRFLRARAISGVELVHTDRYVRAIQIGDQSGWMEITNRADRSLLQAAIYFPEVRALTAIARRINRVFDTRTDIQTVGEHLARDPDLAALVKQRPGLRTPGGWDGFELSIRAILGQQITVAGARTLACRLVQRFGRPLPEDMQKRSGLTHVFPTPEALAAADFTGFGMPRARTATLQALAEAAVADRHLFDRAQSLESAVEKLRSLRGIGEWTAQYIALRALRETDAFPHSDIGLLRGLATNGVRATPAELLARAELWRPWRAYAAQHLWAKDELNDRDEATILPRYAGDAARLAEHRQRRTTAVESRLVG